MIIIWSPQALHDLDDIHSFVLADRPRAAARLRNTLTAAVQGLIRFPWAGRAGRVPNTRELVVQRTPFVVPYKVESSRIVILRVYHGAQSWPAR